MPAFMIRRLITYAPTHGFTSECWMLPDLFSPILTRDCRHVTCDSCGGLIGGPRLFCLDCTMKSTELYDSVDLCCAPKCVAARVTRRRDVEGAHEPNHRLVKVRITVLMRSHGRVHTAACNAFERVGETCRRIAELTLHPSRPSPGGSKGGVGLIGKTVREARQAQVLDQSLPTCGSCRGHLSFPFWFCIFCVGKRPVRSAFLFLNALNARFCTR